MSYDEVVVKTPQVTKQSLTYIRDLGYKWMHFEPRLNVTDNSHPSSPPDTAHSLLTCHLKCPAQASGVHPDFWQWDTHKAQCSSNWYSLRATWVYVDSVSPFSFFRIRSRRSTVVPSLFFSPKISISFSTSLWLFTPKKLSLVATCGRPNAGEASFPSLNLNLMDFPLILLQPRHKTQNSLKYPYKSWPVYSLITAQPQLWLLVLGGNFIYSHIKCFISMQLFQPCSIT